ncbi:MAG: hypothetical protein FDZ75_04890 [Actinobacteria bacterium]|nr:MAG: hypothetical protein FDZ75_04890 [Actinomycetota bacterium]
MTYPYARCEPAPTQDKPVRSVFIDPELGEQGFSYQLSSGEAGCVLLDQVLDHNADPEYVREMLLHRLSIEALRHVASSPLSKREIIRRLGTSAAQFYRLLDPANSRKSLDAMFALLTILGCDVDMVVRERSA